MRLPPEVQTLVCQNMTKTELKNARLICKTLDQAVVPLLFDKVFVPVTYSDLDVADLVTSRFGLYIKTMTLSIVEYNPLSKKDFISYGVFERNGKTLEMVNCHLEHAFEVYCKVRTENLEINKSGELLAKTCLILSKSPNVRKMILTDCGNNDLFIPANYALTTQGSKTICVPSRGAKSPSRIISASMFTRAHRSKSYQIPCI
ncbi:MAG: hypothetical protein ALECFALPRED_006532 [Alectoria fallacina]|uniref:F-box domain-containing protein n=1 Tax=Alectoria fallacina TaxID=1903189 RepID=A0A8H3IZP6_9LECA|nr:MAG: hypothetical protein ALECFALPRED_006532 [Alectoria fallacina]